MYVLIGLVIVNIVIVKACSAETWGVMIKNNVMIYIVQVSIS